MSEPNSLSSLRNCSKVEGTLIIQNLDDACCHKNDCSFPSLVEITGRLIIENGNCSGDLSTFLPNLTIIRNPITISAEPSLKFRQISDYSLIIRHTKLKGLGLRKLTTLKSNHIALIDNPFMCFVDTVDWDALTSSFHYGLASSYRPGKQNLARFNLGDFCPDQCPINCSLYRNESARLSCWSTDFCQAKCSSLCTNNGLTCHLDNPQKCCHQECSGGCFGPSANNCLTCKHVKINGTCLSHCPKPFYLVSLAVKGWVYNASVRAILLFTCEIWPLRAEDVRRLCVFNHRCLCKIACVQWHHRVSNSEVRWRVFEHSGDHHSLTVVIWKHRLQWLGHVLRMSSQRLPYRSLFAASPGTGSGRRRGGQSMTWRHGMKDIRVRLASLNNLYCITREECINRQEVIQNGNDHYSSMNYSIFNTNCVSKCPLGYVRSATGECLLCPESKCAKRACGDVHVYKVSDLKKVRGCVTAQSILISLRDCEGWF
ncbi:unnamed protein product [Trichobilharzia regenti]|nr:unnamed protein product [Trichobilharzia regenti]